MVGVTCSLVVVQKDKCKFTIFCFRNWGSEREEGMDVSTLHRRTRNKALLDM